MGGPITARTSPAGRNTNVRDRIWSHPNSAISSDHSIINPRYPLRFEKIGERPALETGKDIREYDAFRIDLGYCDSRGRGASTITSRDRRIFRCEISVVVVIRRRCRCRAKQELMRGKACPLVGLEHIVSPTIGLDEIQIWIQHARGIINIPECPSCRA